MRVLQLCLRVPYPPADGGTIAMYNMAMALVKAGVQVKILSLNTKKHFIDASTLPEWFVNEFQPEMVFLDASVKPLPAFLNLFGSKSYNISRFDISLFHNTLKQLLQAEKYDVIQLESLFVAPYLSTIRKYSKAKVVLRTHNVEYLIWQRLSESATGLIKKKYLELLTRRLKRYETEMFRKFDGIIALTKEDSRLIGLSGTGASVLVSPIGLDTENYKVTGNRNAFRNIFHLGSMDWLPNIEGVDWFIEQVLPLLIQEKFNGKIFLAGKKMPERLMQINADYMDISGRVDNAREFMSDKSIMIVPLLSGGGMRVKIIEGMALGKTIIATSVGAEGISYTHGKNILIADSPGDFASAIVQCLNDAAFAEAIGQNARVLAENEYDNQVIGRSVRSYYESILQDNNIPSNVQSGSFNSGQ